jgi:polyisoprenyl-phosphate glycosyltransferase
LVGLVFWLGFRREEITYERHSRKYGESTWTFSKKLRYLVDSIFSFTDMPIRLLMHLGTSGVALSLVGGLIVFFGRLSGYIDTPGYAATILTIMFFGALNLMALGIVGGYVWRSFENTKRRPLSVVQNFETFAGRIRTDGNDKND